MLRLVMAAGPMQGLHSMWYDHFKGAVYPLDFESLPCCKQAKTNAPTLLEACCAFIVRDSNLTRAAIDTVPPILCIHMMEAALKGNHDRSVQALMSKWRLRSLVLSKLVPNVFTSVLPLYDPMYLSDLVRQGLRYTTTLAPTFVECLRKATPTELRYLDLSGFPTAEVILYYITSHCMLVHNENRRNNMVTLYNHAVSLAEECSGNKGTGHTPLEIGIENCLPDGISIEIKLDAFVTSESCHSELCKALTVSSFPGVRFRLIVERLTITCLGGDRVNLLLKQIPPEQLKGLQVKYNSLRNTDFVRLAPILQSLTNLTALDLSCNNINLYDNESLADIMKEALSTLTKLERLDLGNNRIKHKLPVVLRGINHPLKHLSVAACGLSTSDLTALTTFPHLEKLEELDLSENSLCSSHFQVAQILSKISHSIKVFQVQDCGISDDGIKLLTCYFKSTPRLLYLNCSGNPWCTDSAIALAEQVSKSPKLLVFRISYPLDSYLAVDGDGDEEIQAQARISFKCALNSIFGIADSDRPQRDGLNIVLNELTRYIE